MKTKTTRVRGGGGKSLEEAVAVKMMCDAIDREVESRAEEIAAIIDGYMAGATTQLQLVMSKFPNHIRKMPMKRFLKQHCPKTIKARDGTLCVGGNIRDVSTPSFDHLRQV